VNSAVQARIEAMFASVEAESGTPGECAAAILSVMTRIITRVEARVRKLRKSSLYELARPRPRDIGRLQPRRGNTCSLAFSLMLIPLYMHASHRLEKNRADGSALPNSRPRSAPLSRDSGQMKESPTSPANVTLKRIRR